MEMRIKTFASIEEKIRRKSFNVETIADVTDLVGLRLILLFRRDLDTMSQIIRDNLDVLSHEDTEDRLTESQFGYQSKHFVVKLPVSWLDIPSYSDLDGLCAEIQVRTLAQHMWAATSHKLQYKREDSIPVPVRRTIHRVSALLETVDLELQRVLEERDTYMARATAPDRPDEQLNVDLIAQLMSEAWPAENIDPDEQYDEVLTELKKLGITTRTQLKNLLDKQQEEVLDYEDKTVRSSDEGDYEAGKLDRHERGVYFTHCGLTRQAMRYEFGSSAADGVISKPRRSPTLGHTS
jgi:ppGpp synthetase/RelA/SpoT-type nucleotidyltranferase